MVGGIKDTDFVNFPLVDVGITVVRTPMTKELGPLGQGDFTVGSTNNVTAVYNPKVDDYIMKKLGLQNNTDAYIMVAPGETINKDDKIVAQSKIYEVINVRQRTAPAGGTLLYKFVELHLISG